MEPVRELSFESPSFARRLKGMLGVDFYRLFHTPLFYIFLCIAVSAPVIKCKKTPRKKCNYVAERREKR